jgi:hypothetical protein
LTKEEELAHGRRIVEARELRGRVDALLEEKRVAREMRRMEAMEAMEEEDEDEEGGRTDDDGDGDDDDLDYDFLSYELEYLSVYGYRRSADMIKSDDDDGGGGGPNASSSSSSLGGYDLGDDLLIEHSQHLSRHVRQLRDDERGGGAFAASPFERRGGNNDNLDEDGDGGDDGGGNNRRDGGTRGGLGGSKSPKASANRNSYASFLQVPLHELTERDASDALGVPGGRAGLVRILLDGAHSREALMRGNVKLVMSVAKGWMRNSYAVAGANGEGAPGGGGGGKGNAPGGAGKPPRAPPPHRDPRPGGRRNASSRRCTTGRGTGRPSTRPCRRGCSGSRGRWTSTTPSAGCGSRRTRRTG